MLTYYRTLRYLAFKGTYAHTSYDVITTVKRGLSFGGQ